MPKRQSIEDVEIQAGTGAVALSVDDYVDTYRLFTSGAVTLTSSVTIDESGTAQLGMEYLFYYQADLDYDGNTFTFFGTQMPTDLEAVNCWVRCFYNGTSWEVTITTSFADEPLITTAMITDGNVTQNKIGAAAIGRTQIADTEVIDTKLATNSVTNAKINTSAVTVDKLGGTLKQEVIIVPVSFETGSLANNSIIIPFDCTLSTIRTDVVTLIEASDNATISPQINTVSTSPSAITLAAGTVANTTATAAMTTAAMSAGDELRLITSKSTPGGRALVTLTLLRT